MTGPMRSARRLRLLFDEVDFVDAPFCADEEAQAKRTKASPARAVPPIQSAVCLSKLRASTARGLHSVTASAVWRARDARASSISRNACCFGVRGSGDERAIRDRGEIVGRFPQRGAESAGALSKKRGTRLRVRGGCLRRRKPPESSANRWPVQ